MKLKKIVIISMLIVMNLQSWSQSLTNLQLKDSISVILKKSNTPNAFVTVVNKDRILFQSEFGYTEQVNNKKRLFALGSISKTFTALAIMKLIDEGKLSLETKLKTVAPEIPFYNKWEKTHPVKIKHLLTHRSGFDDMHIANIIKKRNSDLTALEETLTYNSSYKTNWKPGLVFSYSNPGYIILGYVIEKISGITYQEYITNNILHPLKMDATAYYSVLKKEDLVTGFQRKNDTIESSELPKLIGEAAGGLLSNADDMSHFLQFLLDKNNQDSLQIITKSQLLKMEQLQSNFEISNNVTSGYSIGMYDRHFGSKEVTFKGHNGSINGFSSDYIYNRDLNIGIAISTNLFQKSNHKVLDLLVDNFVTKKEQKVTSKNSNTISNYKDWEGTYRMLNGTNNLNNVINAPARTLSLEIKNDSLFVTQFLGEKQTYVNVLSNSFKNSEDNEVTLFIGKNDNDKALVYFEDTFVKINTTSYYISLILLAFGLLSGVLLTVLFGVQLLALPFKKSLKLIGTTFKIALPFWLITISLIVFLNNSSFLTLKNLGTLTPTSISLFLSTLLFPIITLYVGYKIYKKEIYFKNNFFKTLYTISYFGILYLSLHCIYYGWVALPLWSI